MTYDCIQPNGERLPVEEWAVRAVQTGSLNDPMLVNIVRNAVEIRPSGWPRRAGEPLPGANVKARG